MYRSLLAECNYIHRDNPLEDVQLGTCSMGSWTHECGCRRIWFNHLGQMHRNRQTKTSLPGRPSGPPLDVITRRPVHGVDRRQCKRDPYLYSY